MERSGSPVDVARPHLEDLRELVALPGPFLTVVVARPEPIGKAVEATFHEVRHAVAQTPCADQADDVARRVDDLLPGSAGAVVVAEAGRIALVEALDVTPRHPGVHYGALPVLGAVLERRSADIPVVTAIVDRTGADLSWSAPLPGGATAAGRAEVQGEATFIRKVQAGGWSHRRYQQAAEANWEQTAGEVARTIGSTVDDIRARLVILGGDERMVDLVRADLPSQAIDLVRIVPGSRSEDGSDAERDAVAQRWLRTAIASELRLLLARFGEEKGRADRAADGVEGTLAALRESRVDVLLVHDRGGEDDRTACFVPDDPTLVVRTPAELDEFGARDVRVARAVDVAIRAALLTGADVRIVPDAARLDDGIGALLRW
ncbi:MAG: hypothetical protein KF703_16170 [Actinobacteria bacterium]|nr:hypothetical protein [Actinomycetota bacterium]